MPPTLPTAPVSIDLMMPFYGDPALFRLAIQSILGQTDPDWRLVVIDDQYPDLEPGRWLESLNDPRVTYLRNETNLGVSGNFRKCAALASADFTTIVGCDDLLLPNYVARLRQLLAAFPDADFVQPGVRVMDAAGDDSFPLADQVKRLCRPRAEGPVELFGEDLAASLMRGTWTYFPSIAWRTTRLQRHGFREDLDVALDLALEIDIIVTGGRLVLDDTPSFRYRRHSGSVSSWTANDGSRFVEERRYFLECAERMTALGWNRAARVAVRHVSSRLNALTRVPASVKAGDGRGVRILVLHAFGRPYFRAGVRSAAPSAVTPGE